jgi:hypothetical protein
MIMHGLTGFGKIVYERCMESLDETDEVIQPNYERKDYLAVSSLLKLAVWDSIQMAMIVFTSTKDVERAKLDLLEGVKYVDRLIDLYHEVAILRAGKISDAQLKIDGFEMAQTLVYCMLIKDIGRIENLTAALNAGKNLRYGGDDLRRLSSMLKAYVQDDLELFKENYEKFCYKKSRPTGYDRELYLCLSVLQRDQAKFDEILNEIEIDYPKRKKSRSWQNTQAIFGGGDYNEIFFDFSATALASYAKKLSMQVIPKSDVAIPKAFL